MKTRALLVGVVVFALLGGSAFAGTHFLITSTSQIKPSVLHSLEGKRGPKGATGATGATGAAGPAGVAGPSGASTATVVTASTSVAPTTDLTAAATTITANCPSGENAVSGSAEAYNSDGSPVGELFAAQSRPYPATNGATPTGWTAFLQESNAPDPGPQGETIVITAYAICEK